MTGSDDSTTEERNDETTAHRDTDYLDAEVNILRPSTPFMRDHLRLIWIGFLAWTLVVFGPVTATYFLQDTMTAATVLGFPLHYLLVAVGAPVGTLVLSIVYSWQRDKLDRKYGIDHSDTAERPTEASATATTDGGTPTRVADAGPPARAERERTGGSDQSEGGE